MSDAEQFLSHLSESAVTTDRPELPPASAPRPTPEPDPLANLPVNSFRDLRDDGGSDRRLHIIARYQAEEMALNGASPDILRPPSLPFPWVMADQEVAEQMDQGDG